MIDFSHALSRFSIIPLRQTTLAPILKCEIWNWEILGAKEEWFEKKIF